MRFNNNNNNTNICNTHSVSKHTESDAQNYLIFFKLYSFMQPEPIYITLYVASKSENALIVLLLAFYLTVSISELLAISGKKQSQNSMPSILWCWSRIRNSAAVIKHLGPGQTCDNFIFWHASLGVHSAIHQPPQRAVLSQVDCFVQCKAVGSQISLDGVQPRDMGTPWW